MCRSALSNHFERPMTTFLDHPVFWKGPPSHLGWSFSSQLAHHGLSERLLPKPSSRVRLLPVQKEGCNEGMSGR